MTIFLAEAYLHGLDPFAIEFPAGWPLGGIRWYGLAYLTGFVVAWLVVRWLANTHRTSIPPRIVPDLMIYALVGVLVGGRVGYCVFYDPGLIVKVTSRFPFWGLLAINEGGMSSHGGIVGVITALWVFAVRNHLSRLHIFDVACLVSPPGLFFGRLANFVNAELWGRRLPEAMQSNQRDAAGALLPETVQGHPPWWSIRYPQEIEQWAASPPRLGDLGEAVQGLGVSAAEWNGVASGLVQPDVTNTLRRLVEAVQDGNAAVADALRPLLTAHYPSQLIQALTDGPLLLGIMVLVWWGPRKPGVVGSGFLIAYGVMRILSELLREPDAGVSLLVTPLGELSRGQVLSVLMVVAGLVALPIVMRREVEPVGGLIHPSE